MASNHMFQVKRVASVHPNREGCRHMLKTSELGQGWQKGLCNVDWPDQESNLHPIFTKCARGTQKGKKKLEGKSKMIWRHPGRPEIQAQFNSNHKIWQWHVSGMQQHSLEIKTHWPSPVLHGYLAYRKVDAEDTTPGLTRSICSFDSCFGHDLGPWWLLNLSQPPAWE